MRLTHSEWRRIGILAAISLLVAAVLVFQGIGDDTPDDATSAPVTAAPEGPSASSQVADAEATGAVAVESTDDVPVDSEPAEDGIVQQGDQTFTGALTGPIQFGSAAPESELQFSVAVEDGIGVEATELAQIVDQVLADPRSWPASPNHSLVRVPTAGAFQLVVTSPDTTDEICAPLQTIGQLSCAIDGVIAINLTRWLTGSRGWNGTLDDYRTWVVNHEIGHQLGFTHRTCAELDAVADVMQQQSIDLDGCTANPWPFPDGIDLADVTSEAILEPTPTPTPISTDPEG